ncbi:MAG: hypothetical protein JXB88_08370 [Spirochaetales bacterium]|nr:hypothetical protein [Spirochaetales bacterium]
MIVFIGIKEAVRIHFLLFTLCIIRELESFKDFYSDITQKTDDLGKALNRILNEQDMEKASHLCVSTGDRALEELRKIVDELETLVPVDSWPLTKYQELLL